MDNVSAFHLRVSNSDIGVDAQHVRRKVTICLQIRKNPSYLSPYQRPAGRALSFSVPSVAGVMTVVVRGVEVKSRTKLFGAVRTNKLIEPIESGSQ